jgi:Domain of unknown function (DUF4335)
MPLSNSVTRRYTPPTCTLEVAAQSSPLSRWTKKSVLKDVQFELQFDDPRLLENERVTVRGDRDQLEALCTAVSDYVQQQLQESPETYLGNYSAPVKDSHSAADNSGSSPQTATIPVAQFPRAGIHLEPGGNLTHNLFLGPLAKQATQPVVKLSLLQLYDLASALDEYSNDVMALPNFDSDEEQQLPRRRSFAIPKWAPAAAVVAVAVGLAPLTWDQVQKFAPTIASNQEDKPASETGDQIAANPTASTSSEISPSPTPTPGSPLAALPGQTPGATPGNPLGLIPGTPGSPVTSGIPGSPITSTGGVPLPSNLQGGIQPSGTKNIPDSSLNSGTSPIGITGSPIGGQTATRGTSLTGSQRKLNTKTPGVTSTFPDLASSSTSPGFPPGTFTNPGSVSGFGVSGANDRKNTTGSGLNSNTNFDSSFGSTTANAPTEKKGSSNTASSRSASRQKTSPDGIPSNIPPAPNSIPPNNFPLDPLSQIPPQLPASLPDADITATTSGVAVSSRPTAFDSRGINSVESSSRRNTDISLSSRLNQERDRRNGNLATGTLFDSSAQIAEARQFFQQRWNPPSGLTKPLTYIVDIDIDGSIQGITPLGSASKKYIDQSGMPLPGERLVSANQTGKPVRVRVVLSPDGKVKTFSEK